MNRICKAALCMAWLIATAGISLAQEPVPSLTLPNTEVYGNFVVTSPDYGPHWDSILFYGFGGGVSKGLTEHLWVTGAINFVWGNPSLPDGFGNPVPMHAKLFSGTVGPKYYFLTRDIRPYGTFQIGYARLASNGLYGGDHTIPTPFGVPRTESGFTYLFGGGAEWQLKRKWYWRVAQIDWQPQPWGRHKPFYVNLSSGVGYRF